MYVYPGEVPSMLYGQHVVHFVNMLCLQVIP
jgi:hypothetical protein